MEGEKRQESMVQALLVPQFSVQIVLPVTGQGWLLSRFRYHCCWRLVLRLARSGPQMLAAL